MNVRLPLIITASVLYSSGLGQALAVPGSAISGIAQGILKCKEKRWDYKSKSGALNADERRAVEAKVQEYHDKAYDAKTAAIMFLLGGIPVLGGLVALYHKDKRTGYTPQEE